ncbi:hypothetical protein J4416_00135 [Candidatus Pacearchaeota archaeon]|nr:hypothetical protein [Candidatus Pacearchaeota archaeon]
MERAKNNKLKNRIKKEIEKTYKHKRLIIGTISLIVLIMIYLFKDSSSITLRYSTFIALIVAFYLADHLLDIQFKLKHYLFIIIIGSTSILFYHLYFIYPQYDKLQHFILPMLICSIIFFMINKLKLALKWKLTFTVLSVTGILGMFEIGEFILDLFFNLKLQGVYIRDLTGLEKFNLLLNPLDDTMADLSFGILGSLFYATYAWIKYSKYKKMK